MANWLWLVVGLNLMNDDGEITLIIFMTMVATCSNWYCDGCGFFFIGS